MSDWDNEWMGNDYYSSSCRHDIKVKEEELEKRKKMYAEMSKQEKQIRKEFKDHKVKLLNKIEGQVEVWDWRHKDENNNWQMQFTILGKQLIVTGDLGDNTFNWYGNGMLDLEWLSTLNIGYMLEKRQAKDIHEDSWRSETCRTEALRSITELFGEGYHEGIELDKLLTDFNEDTKYTECFESECHWVVWLQEHGEKYFGEDHFEFTPNLGKVLPFKLEAIKVALVMMVEQLKEGD